MDITIRHEIKALQRIARNSGLTVLDLSLSSKNQYIYCYTRKELCVDLYSWRRDVSGAGNYGSGWDVDKCEQEKLVISFPRTKNGFRQAYRLARLCVRVPSIRD